MTTLHGLWDTTRMQLLVALERDESLSKAAQAIGIGQPAASEHLRLLERAAGERLTVRTGRGLRLTEVGHVLASHAAHALASLEAGEQHLASRAGLTTGSLRLGASPVPGIYILPEVLTEFGRVYPGVQLGLTVTSTRQILDDLIAGRIQLAVICTDVQDERIVLQPLMDDQIAGIAQPGLLSLSGGTIPSQALIGETLLVQEPGSSTRKFAMDILAAQGAAWGNVWELGSIEAVKRAARKGLGVGFLSRHTVTEECQRGELATFQISDVPLLHGKVSLARLARSPFSPAAQHFSRMFSSQVGT
jgi:DNA-binding transcriptional LysR family regulator